MVKMYNYNTLCINSSMQVMGMQCDIVKNKNLIAWDLESSTPQVEPKSTQLFPSRFGGVIKFLEYQFS